MTHARAREPFSVLVTSPEWIGAADAWVEQHLEALGIAVLGPVTSVRVRAWSTQRTVPTSAGTVWFKADCPTMAFEPALHQALAVLAPDAVETPLAIDAERGWLLTLDHGPSIGDESEVTTAHWQAVVQEAAALQREVSEHRDELLATGLPDCSPGTVLDRFDSLLDEFDLDAPNAARLAARRPELADACAALADTGSQVTWNHGDLHPWNVHGSPDRPRLFDFGDSQWAHAAEVLAVPFGFCAENPALSWDGLVDAWREVWEVDRTTFDLAWNAVNFTQPVNRALTWHRCLVAATDAENEQWGDESRHHLLRILDA